MLGTKKEIVTYTAKELATILCIARNTVYQHRRKGNLPSGQKHGTRRIWTKEELVTHSPQLNHIFSAGE